MKSSVTKFILRFNLLLPRFLSDVANTKIIKINKIKILIYNFCFSLIYIFLLDMRK